MGFTSACALQHHALGEAYRAIAHGYADAIIISGGSEAISPRSPPVLPTVWLLATTTDLTAPAFL